MQIGQDGTAGFRTMTRMLTESVHVDRDLLCEQSENIFGRPEFGPYYRLSDETGPGYTYINSDKDFRFIVAH